MQSALIAIPATAAAAAVEAVIVDFLAVYVYHLAVCCRNNYFIVVGSDSIERTSHSHIYSPSCYMTSYVSFCLCVYV